MPPIVDDIIEIGLVSELDGVQMSNTLYFEIDSVGTDPTVFVGLGDIMDAYVTAIAPTLSNQWKLVCGIYDNITNPEGKTLKFDTQPGTGVGDCHPQKQVVRFNRYANQTDFLKIHRGSFSQSGTLESLSTRGRLNDKSVFAAMITFLNTSTLLGGDRWTVDPNLRWNSGTIPVPVYEFDPVIVTQLSGRLLTLNSRKTNLCAVS